jgi:hypothetical protein
MHAVLCAIKRASGKNILVTKPHGAESGWDPHSGYENLNNNNFFEWLLDPEVTTDILAKAHRDVLEEPKSVRIGRHKYIEKEYNAPGRIKNGVFKESHYIDRKPDTEAWEELAKRRRTLRKWFDKNFYSMRPDSKHKRILCFCFLRAGPILIKRFLESDGSLKGIYIIIIPWGDPIPRAGGSNFVKERRKVDPSVANMTNDQISSLLTREAVMHTYNKYSSMVHFKLGDKKMKFMFSGNFL